MPLLVPEDGDADKLVGDHHGLVDQGGGVIANLVEDLVGRVPAGGRRGLGGHRQRVDQGLGVTFLSFAGFLKSSVSGCFPTLG